MASTRDLNNEPAEAISCFCKKCGTKFGGLRNSWLQLSKSYFTPSGEGFGGFDGVRESGKAKEALKSLEFRGYTIKPLGCVICRSTIGVRCIDGAPKVGDIQFRNRDFFKHSRISIMSDTSNLPVEAEICQSVCDAALEPPRTTYFDCTDIADTMEHKVTLSKSQSCKAPTAGPSTAQMVASRDETTTDVQRLQEMCVLLEGVTRSQKQDIDSISEDVKRIERNMREISDSVNQLKQEFAARPSTFTPTGYHNYNQEIQILTRNITDIGRKAHEVDELRLLLGLMDAKIRKLEEVNGEIDASKSSAMLCISAADSEHPQGSSGPANDLSRRPSCASLENPDEDFSRSSYRYGDENNENNLRRQLPNGASFANMRASLAAQPPTDAAPSPTKGLDATVSPQPSIMRHKVNLPGHDDPEDADYRPGQQRGNPSLRRARGARRGRLSRQQPRLSLPNRFPTPEWEKPDFTYVPAPSGFYSPYTAPSQNRSRKVARRGSGGVQSESKKAKLHDDQPLHFPLRNEQGTRLKKNGEPDMRGQWKRARGQRQMLMGQGRAIYSLEQQTNSKGQIPTSRGVGLNTTHNASNDTDEHCAVPNNINNPIHTAMMNKIFPNGIRRNEHQTTLAKQLFGSDKDQNAQLVVETKRAAAMESGSSGEDE